MAVAEGNGEVRTSLPRLLPACAWPLNHHWGGRLVRRVSMRAGLRATFVAGARRRRAAW